MEKREARYILHKTAGYRLRRDYWSFNLMMFIIQPPVALLFVIASIIQGAITGAMAGVLKEVKGLYAFDGFRIRPRWVKRNKETDEMITEAKQVLGEGL